MGNNTHGSSLKRSASVKGLIRNISWSTQQPWRYSQSEVCCAVTVGIALPVIRVKSCSWVMAFYISERDPSTMVSTWFPKLSACISRTLFIPVWFRRKKEPMGTVLVVAHTALHLALAGHGPWKWMRAAQWLGWPDGSRQPSFFFPLSRYICCMEHINCLSWTEGRTVASSPSHLYHGPWADKSLLYQEFQRNCMN